MRPESGFRNPVTILKSVVLPAPLGPMSPVMLPSLTGREQPSTARKPPKDFVTLSTARIAAFASPVILSASRPATPVHYERVGACGAPLLSGGLATGRSGGGRC